MIIYIYVCILISKTKMLLVGTYAKLSRLGDTEQFFFFSPFFEFKDLIKFAFFQVK